MAGQFASPSVTGDSQLWADMQVPPSEELFRQNSKNQICCFSDLPSSVLRAQWIFKRLLESNEKSQRLLLLSNELLRYNPNSYTVWKKRRESLTELNLANRSGTKECCAKDSEKWASRERDFVLEFCRDFPKSYQVWHHRRWLLSLSGNFSEELGCLEAEIKADSKNMNMWGLRAFIIKETRREVMGSWQLGTRDAPAEMDRRVQRSRDEAWFEGEMRFTDELIEADIHNNSVYSHRRFVIQSFVESLAREPSGQSALARQQGLGSRKWGTRARLLWNSEIRRTAAICERDFSNEAAWSYLRSFFYLEHTILTGFASDGKKTGAWEDKFYRVPWNESLSLKATILRVVEKGHRDGPPTRFSLYVLFLLSLSDGRLTASLQTLDSLRECDPLRSGYWESKKKLLAERYQTAFNGAPAKGSDFSGC